MLPLATCRQFSTCFWTLVSKRAMSRGAFIVFEGCDRSGKTTQCKKLVDTLNEEGHRSVFCRFPERDTAIGRVINDYLEKKIELEDHAVHLLFAANRWEAVPKMMRLIEQGTTLIVDRYSFSGVAFTAAKQGFNLDWCREPEKGLPMPDAVVYLTLSPEEAARRSAFGGERYEQTDFQTRVSHNYQLLKEDYWQEVDASKPIEELHTDIKQIVLKVIDQSKEKPMGKLWMKVSDQSTTDSLICDR